MTYTAYVMYKQDRELTTITRSDYTSKKAFAEDLRRNGYAVKLISTPEKFNHDLEVYCEKKERRNEIDRFVRAELKKSRERIKAATEELTKANKEEETTTLKNYDEVRETLIETITDLETRKNRYQTDIYLYIDENGHGTIDTFANVGGNSWLNDDHITIYTDREHYETKLDDLQNGYGRGAWDWLINELENSYNLTGIKAKIYNLCCDDDDDDPSFKSFDDLESYDIESALYALYCDEIDNYYKDYFIPDFCMDDISERADRALDEYR